MNKPPLYRIKNWVELYENNRTRDLVSMRFVCIPNKHDGDGYTELLDHTDGMAHYGAWILLAAVASKCTPRGTLVRDTGEPYDPVSLARVTRGSVKVFTAAINRFIVVGWLETLVHDPVLGYILPVIPQQGAGIPQAPAGSSIPFHSNQISSKQDESKKIDLEAPHEAFVTAWNALGKPFKSIECWTSARRKNLEARWRDKFFRDNWISALEKMSKSDFCMGGKGWVANVDFFLRQKSVIKLIEGNYDGSVGTNRTGPKAGYRSKEQQTDYDLLEQRTEQALPDGTTGDQVESSPSIVVPI